MLNILIVSDHKPFREALTRLLLAQPLFRLAGVCADTHAAIFISACTQPDIVLIDGSSDPLAAIEATKKIVSCSTASVIALSLHLDSGFARHMMAAGALGYLTKRSFSTEIITAVTEVAKDNLYLCNELCLENNQLTVPTPTAVPERTSFFKKSKSAIRQTIKEKITAGTAPYWHGILRFTN